jgi:hypothetical protein
VYIFILAFCAHKSYNFQVISSAMFLTRLVSLRAVSRRFPRRGFAQASVSAQENGPGDGEGLIFNSVVGGRKHIKRQSRLNQLIKEDQLRQDRLDSPDTPLSLSFLSPELKSQLLGDLEDKKNVKSPTPADLSTFADNLKAEKRKLSEGEEAEIEIEGEHRLDFMMSTDSDPAIPPSQVPCGGCGAHLHCQDANFPGFIPIQFFEGVSPRHLRAQICQRCYILKNHKKALQVEVSPDDYPKILRMIKDKRALVVLIVDLMDFPCSIWPHLNDVIGNEIFNLICHILT